ncbi:sequence-specific DNA-binding high mobility group box protein mat-Mc, partial [Basidiobolus meristosporus CBS 931.73]
RPLNPFLLFRKDVQASIFAQNPGISNSEVSKVIGQMWKDAPFDVKERYQLSAEDKKRLHKEMYPNYKYAPER